MVCATTNGTALAGTDYTGSTNLLTWNSGDVTPRTVTIPLLNNHQVGANKQFGIVLYNPTNNAVIALAFRRQWHDQRHGHHYQ